MRGCKEAVVEGKNGYIINPRNVQELVDAMEKMLKLSQKEINLMSDYSYEIAIKRFDINKINSKMVKILEGE